MLQQDSLQQHALPKILKDMIRPDIQFFKNPVCQPLKADNINIHGSVAGMHGYNIPLRLHGKLLRHQKKKGLLRLPHGSLNDFLIYQPAFTGPAGSLYNLNHMLLLTCLLCFRLHSLFPFYPICLIFLPGFCHIFQWTEYI